MRGLLIGMNEAVQGETYPLEIPEILIGRTAACAIRLGHRSVSREHCLIRVHEDRIEIHDRDSHNGTFVNGLPVRERVLLDGDQVMAGAVEFLFRAVAPGANPAANPALAEPSMLESVGAANVPLAREAATLIRIGEAARRVQSLYLERTGRAKNDSSRQLMEAIFGLIPSRRGALTLFFEGEGEETLLADYDADRPDGSLAVPREAKQKLLEARGPVTGIAKGTAWLACPLLVSGRMVGSLYLDAGTERRDYGSRDLPMIAAVADVLGLAIENARDLELLQLENTRLRAQMTPDSALVGESKPMCDLQASILKVARANTTVLIRGESGTGKELVAKAVHRNSARSGGPFVAVNCAAVAETLLESKFFGHEKGAFTGAAGQRKGRFELAHQGTVFLDEIGELNLTVQAKLLRVLQEREFERVGGSRPVKVDVRIIAATNRDLDKAVREGTFREDLFYRLNVVQLQVPPLRERRGDILLLASHFVGRFSEETGRPVNGFSREARAILAAYDWPGNVRELQNVMERAVVMGSSEVVVADDLPDVLLDANPVSPTGETAFHESVRAYRRRLVAAALELAGGNVAEAARALKLHPVYLHRLITSLNLR